MTVGFWERIAYPPLERLDEAKGTRVTSATLVPKNYSTICV